MDLFPFATGSERSSGRANQSSTAFFCFSTKLLDGRVESISSSASESVLTETKQAQADRTKVPAISLPNVWEACFRVGF